MSADFLVTRIGKATVVDFQIAALMDALQLERIGQQLYRLVDAEDSRVMILDLTKVQYLSSQAVGILITLHKKLGALKGSRFILCGVGPKMLELLRITRLDRVLTIKASQKEALNAVAIV